MRNAGFWVLFSALLLTVTILGCGGGSGGGGGGGGGSTTPQPGTASTQSSSIALSIDGNFLVNVNPDTDSISVFQPTTLSKLAEIPVGFNPESVVIHPTAARAYVANSKSGTVSVVSLPSGPVNAILPVGKEPMALALSPNGTRLYVAESASNAISVIDTTTNTIVATVDLSAFGTAPRAVSVTNNGDAVDTDESIFVAMFYGQLRAGKTFLEEGQDDQREGRVVRIAAATNLVVGGPIVLAPVANAGFNSNGKLAPAPAQVPSVASTNPQTFTTPTGAFPNQLASIALQPLSTRAYVVSTAASPNGPLRFNQMIQGLVSVFDRATNLEITGAQTDPLLRRTAPLNMNQGINLQTSPAKIFLSNPVAMAWRPNGTDAWVVIQNADLLVRLTEAGGIPTVANPLVAGASAIVRVDLNAPPAGKIVGKAPRGVVINAAGTRLWVHNFISRSLTSVDITTGTAPVILDTALASPLPLPNSVAETVQLGAELFYAGRGPQDRMSSESWGGCITCHPAGRSDNVTWMFDAGPRQTIPLDSTFDKANPLDRRILNWSAVRDEVHDFELNTRNVFGGRGLIDDDRQFFAIGGASTVTPVDSAAIEQFQQATFAVGSTNDLAGGAALPNLALLLARRDFATVTTPDAHVFIIGGRSGAGQGSLVGSANAILEFNPRTNTLVARTVPTFTLRHSLGAAAVRTNLGVRIYMIGGYTSTSAAVAPTTLVQEFDPATGVIRTVAALPTAVAQFGIAVAGGINTAEPLQLIHVVSGNTLSEAVPDTINLTPVQRFQADPVGAGAWSVFGPVGLTLRRNLGAATALRGASSRIFVIGGQDAVGTVLGTVEEYVAQTGVIVATTHTALPAPLARFGIGSSLTTNQIYVAGGQDGAAVDQTAVLEYAVATNGGVAGPAGTPSGLWTTRGNLATAKRSLGLSTPPSVTNFLPLSNAARDARQDAISAWVQAAVRTARAPVGLPASILAGRTLFSQVALVAATPAQSCASCHGGVKWTRSRVDYPAPPSPEIGLGLGSERVIGAELRQTVAQPALGVLLNVGTFTLAGARTNEVRFNGADISQAVVPLGANGFNIPSLLSLHETGPYYYNGLAQTLDEVLNGSKDTFGGIQAHFVALPANRADLIAFLRSIDDTTVTFP